MQVSKGLRARVGSRGWGLLTGERRAPAPRGRIWLSRIRQGIDASGGTVRGLMRR